MNSVQAQTIKGNRTVPSSVAAAILFLFIGTAFHFWLLKAPCYFEKKARLIEKARHCDIVLLGSSHTLAAVRPDSMSRSATSLANIAQSLKLDEQILEKVLRKPGGIKLVVIPVSYFRLYYKLTSAQSVEFRDPLYSHYMGVRERKDLKAAIDLRYWNLVAAYRAGKVPFPVFGAQSGLDSPPLDKSGWASGYSVGDRWTGDDAARRRIDFHHSIMNRKHEKCNKKAIERMISLSRKNGAKVLLLVPLFPQSIHV